MSNDGSTPSDDDNETIGNLERSENPASEEPDATDTMPAGDDSETPIQPSEPDNRTEDELDTADVREFFKRKGAVEILAQLADGAKRFGEIDDALVVSHGTISTRLTDGAKLGLWREFITYPDDGGKIKLYELTRTAQQFAAIADNENISETTALRRQAKDKHDTAVSNFRAELQSTESET